MPRVRVLPILTRLCPALCPTSVMRCSTLGGLYLWQPSVVTIVAAPVIGLPFSSYYLLCSHAIPFNPCLSLPLFCCWLACEGTMLGYAERDAVYTPINDYIHTWSSPEPQAPQLHRPPPPLLFRSCHSCLPLPQVVLPYVSHGGLVPPPSHTIGSSGFTIVSSWLNAMSINR